AWLQQVEAHRHVIMWGLNKTNRMQDPQIAVGDKLVFKWADFVWHDLWIMDNKKAFGRCDFMQAKRLRPPAIGGKY
ncbi:unnamed protein product, partial [Closterium sp. Naga37s-1]